jgi:hypothetical protein
LLCTHTVVLDNSVCWSSGQDASATCIAECMQHEQHEPDPLTYNTTPAHKRRPLPALQLSLRPRCNHVRDASRDHEVFQAVLRTQAQICTARSARQLVARRRARGCEGAQQRVLTPPWCNKVITPPLRVLPLRCSTYVRCYIHRRSEKRVTCIGSQVTRDGSFCARALHTA